MNDIADAAIPRVTYERLPSALADRLRPRVERLGYLGEFFQVGALQPASLAAFVDFTEATKDALPPATVEVVALTAAALLGNEYERNQHQRLCIALGLSRDWVAAVETCAPQSTTVLTDEQKIVQHFVVAALERRPGGARREFDEVVRTVGPEAAVAVLFLLGRYAAHSLFVSTVGIQPPVPSIWEEVP